MSHKTPVIGYHDLYVSSRGPMSKPISKFEGNMCVSCYFDSNMSFLFPYINAEVEKAEFFDSPHMIRFLFSDTYCVLYPEWLMATPVDDKDHARIFVENLVRFLEDINTRKDEITPKYKVFRQMSVLNILKILPKSNCGECGFPTCMAFAASLSKQQTAPGRCPHIGHPSNEQASYPILDKNGKLISTVTLDINMNDTHLELQQKNQYIEELEKKISELSRMKKTDQETANTSIPSPLSGREMEILSMIAFGATNTEIAQVLNISTHTVKSHVIHIFNKLGVNDRTQAAVWAVRHNIA